MPWKIAPSFTARNRVLGKCSSCNLPLRKRHDEPTGHEKAVLTGLLISFEGEVQYCMTCVLGLIKELGYVSPEAHKAALDATAEQKIENDLLKEEISEKTTMIRSLTRELNAAHASV